MRFILTLTLFLSFSVFAWDSIGHRVIAQIAYDKLSAHAKKQVDALTATMFHSPYPSARFLRASTWPDQIKSQTTQYNTWHYINLPFVKDDVKPPPLSADNVVWAIARAEKIVSGKAENNARRAKYLSFLIHFIGDIHQPLHCAELYDDHFSHGDQGGNLYPIDSPMANNLHVLWDRGLGLFFSPKGNYQFHYYQVQKIALQWMHEYPRTFFAKQLQVQSPSLWAQESYHIATTFVYTLPLNAKPSDSYIQQGQVIVREQSVLAGDRLADVLNQLV